MDTYPDVAEHESSAKRIKLDLRESNIGELCNGGDFSSYSTSVGGPIDIPEGISPDCDSGYEASTLESIPTSSHQTSPHTDPGDVPESLSSLSEIFLTPSRTDQADTSQDSIEADDDNASTVSEISGLSDLSGQDWKPMAGSMIWIQKQMQNGVNPRTLLSDLGVDLDQVPQYVDEITLWKLIINMLAEPPRRNKLRHVNTLDDVVRLVKGAQNIIVLTGAGVSVSCGIPDFRSRDGIYVRLAIDFPDLPDPQAMFDISYFSQDPRPFFKFARDIYPGKFTPSPCHRFIKMLENYGKLLRNYTQNIDTLEKVANIEKVIECHGSFATATCTKCGHKVTADAIREIVLAQQIPLCEKCHPGKTSVPCIEEYKENSEEIDYRQLVSSGIMKPDIVFFGEGLPDTFHEAMAQDKTECDLLLVIGSSLKVRPVALIPSSLPPHVPQILINREPLPHCHFDVELLGDCDVIVNHLCHLFGGVWKEGVFDDNMLEEASHLLPLQEPSFDMTPPCVKSQTEPNCTDDNLEKASPCLCSTKCSSSSTVEKDEELTLECSCNKQTSIINKQSLLDSDLVNSLDLKSVKERHMSVDSARDSGIGDNSNFTDLETKYDDTSDENPDLGEYNTNTNTASDPQFTNISNDEANKTNTYLESTTNTSDLKGFWQPKIKKSLAERLPPKSFYLVKPSRYIFPGAEIYYDPDEKFGYYEGSSSSNNSDSESENGEPVSN
ncbi:NAD-dependent histone deacetylase Sir2-like Protein [Tribolium castaneum]|uniref:protein acetyllysine N-acetyltransferase n=1 Tax=Tribolium castaneum TaxID=7070 RepID=D6WFJ9_TRICA|nr:PREDICTED: NAD-dependent histone deacetylase Sir2 [Tribolium castaneum]EEZ99804.1 NAD-dependent histone deacetylase Sir2-like Protein [Tribolium castaneum]|eukprot:XP_008191290.1 PREDICTED: NAD-dependent histone deacetylase Sir2 [Tribolium castaneum]